MQKNDPGAIPVKFRALLLGCVTLVASIGFAQVPASIDRPSVVTAAPPQRVVVISMTGVPFSQITRSAVPAPFKTDQQYRDERRQQSPTEADDTVAATVTSKLDRVSAGAFKDGADSLIETQFALAYRAASANTDFGLLARGKNVLAQASAGLPDDAAVANVQAQLKRLAESAPADKYVLILPYRAQDWSKTGSVSGIGWLGKRGLTQADLSHAKLVGGAHSSVAAFAYLRFVVFDGKTFQLENIKTLAVHRNLPGKKETGLDPWTSYSEEDRVTTMQTMIERGMKAAVYALMSAGSPEQIPGGAGTR